MEYFGEDRMFKIQEIESRWDILILYVLGKNVIELMLEVNDIFRIII